MSPQSRPDLPAAALLAGPQIVVLALSSAVVTANAYYIHPIIARVAESFGISDGLIGIVPAMNQIALALGIFFILPLGDRISNRKLVWMTVTGQLLSVVAMALASQFWVFLMGSTLLGFFTIAPYLLPAYVSKRVDPGRLGHATAILTTGIIGGILLARAGAGVIGEFVGWRAVYVIAAGLMLVVSIFLPLIMTSGGPKPEDDQVDVGEQGYLGLLLSIFTIVRREPGILVAGSIQGLNFGIFLAVWIGLGLYLTSENMGYGVDTVGYLAAVSIFSLATTPVLGRMADRIGARRARLYLVAIQLAASTLFLVFGHSLWLLVIPLLITNLGGPVIDITGRMTFLSKTPTIRTRLMTIYVVMMFLGGGAASWASTLAYDLAGWTGNGVLAVAMALAMFALSAIDFVRHRS
jgi:predicted MFS family arabinose efflux permease